MVESILVQHLTAYFEDLKHQDLAQQLIEKAVKAARVREAARKARDVAPHQKRSGGRAVGGQAFQLYRAQAGNE